MLLSSCSGVREGLSLKKKQEVDEFLIEKKNPLILPPNFSKLPKPREEMENQNKEDKNIDLSNVLEQSEKTKDIKSSSDLERSISNILKKK